MPNFRTMPVQPAFYYYGYCFFFGKKPARCCPC